MDFSEYQRLSRKTAVYPNLGRNIVYPTLGLCGEAGEVAEKVKKIIRDDNSILTSKKRELLKQEYGDVLWYLSNSCDELGFTLEEVATANVEKLRKRQAENKLHGSGDVR
jgi:NTP pyrophosphatase (non-canonical NTP hydrolase)